MRSAHRSEKVGSRGKPHVQIALISFQSVGLLVTGGRDGAAYEPNSYHKSSELLQDDGQWSLGSSEVPVPISNACMVHFNSTLTLLLGN